jgi:hypothetical protein
MNNRIYGLTSGLLFLILFRFSQLSKTESNVKEGFTQESVNNFINLQNTINKQTIFDMNVIGGQASQEDLDYFNQNGMWPWSDEVIEIYKNAVTENPYVRSLPDQSVNEIRRIYNEAAILRILSYQSKEGKFLLDGILISGENEPNGFGDFGYTSKLISNLPNDSVVKCNLKDEYNPTIERIKYSGKSSNEEDVSSVDFNDLENVVPGFTFLDKPCNPCKSMSPNPDYSCPFELKLKNKSSSTSEVWKYLWGINNTD